MDNLEYSDKELVERSKIIEQLNYAFQQRTQEYTELDGMTYDQWYVANKKAASGYIRPKLNRADVRTATGTTREKCGTVVSA